MSSENGKTNLRLRLGRPLTDVPPSAFRVAGAAVLSVILSVAANDGIVKWATTEFPSTKNYAHFRLVDYATLTAVGVVAACLAWFVTTRVTSYPRWFFLRLAIVAMLVLWIPDVYLFVRHEPTSAVWFLMLMHLAVALITYNAAVHLAPMRSRARVDQEADPESAETDSRHVLTRGAWTTMMLLVGAEMLLGFAELLSVPFDRPNGWVIRQGEAVTLLHGAIGGVLGLGALVLFLLASNEERIERIGAVVGLVGVVIGAIGGFCCYAHSLRLVGMVLMFLGGATAFFGYLMPTIDDAPKTSHAEPGLRAD
jgi:hypothetical protein